MDISFEIRNEKDDIICVVLSYYDALSLGSITTNPAILSLNIYDVTLWRKSGSGNVGHKVLNAVCKKLMEIIKQSNDTIFCFVCDFSTDVPRRHRDMSPQEYRSNLFTRMFESFARHNDVYDLVNDVNIYEDNGEKRYFHFICSLKYLNEIHTLRDILMESK
ncbi:MAG: hypothetical protein LUD17_10920 [Bacteroidales bacterium]|nr:hypothetical protein [Bacteroidales bacterium]